MVIPHDVKYGSDGILHFIYGDGVGYLKYGFENSTGIYTQTNPYANRSSFGRIAPYSTNTLHFVYLDTVNDWIYYSKKYPDQSWEPPVQIYYYGDVFPGIIPIEVLDIGSNAYVGIMRQHDDYDHDLLLRYDNGGSWTTEILEEDTAGGSFDMAINSSGVLHMCTYNKVYWRTAPGTWQYIEYGDYNDYDESNSLKLIFDEDDNIHIFNAIYNPGYYSSRTQHAKYNILSSTWSYETLSIPGGQKVTAAIDKNQIIYVSGFSGTPGEPLNIISGYKGANWSDPESISGQYGNLWLRATPNPQLSYITLLTTDESTLFLVQGFSESTGSSEIEVTGGVYYYNATKVEEGIQVIAIQNDKPFNAATNSTGDYELYVFALNESVTIHAEKDGYTGSPVTFTPDQYGVYIANLLLLPEGFNSSAIGGFVYQKPFYDTEPGVLVEITNGSWYNSTTTNNIGAYIFIDDIVGGEEYTLTASAPKHESQSVNATAVAGNFTQQDFILNESFNLTVQIKDIDTLAFISDREVNVILSSGSEQSTTNGSVVFTNLTYQYYSIDATAMGYYPGSGSTLLDDDKTVIVYMQEQGGDTGSGISYEEHDVRFIVTNEFGMPISGATVTATAINSTTPWDWLNSWFGISTAVNIQNTTLSGFTGSEGSVVFPMVRSVNYQIDISKPSAGISHSVNVMPQESTYTVRVNTGLLPNVGGGYPRFSLDATENGTYVDLTMTYNDASNQTSAITFTVKDDEGNVVYQTNPTLSGGAASATFSVENVRGTSRTFGFNASHTTHGEIQNWQGIDLKGTGRLIDLGFSDPLIYVWISLAIIFIFAGAVGETDVKIGAFLVPILGGGTFWYIGWLPASLGLVIAIGASLGGVYYMRASESKVKS